MQYFSSIDLVGSVPQALPLISYGENTQNFNMFETKNCFSRFLNAFKIRTGKVLDSSFDGDTNSMTPQS